MAWISLIFFILIVGYLLGTSLGSDRDLIWLMGGRHPTGSEAVTFRAHIARHTTGRVAGGIIGILIGITVNLRRDYDPFASTAGTSLTENLLSWWLAGIIIGAMVAQISCLPLPKTAHQRFAVLDPRPGRPSPKVTWAAWILTGVAVVLSLVSLLLWGVNDGLAGAFFALLIIILFPQLVLFLPDLLMN